MLWLVFPVWTVKTSSTSAARRRHGSATHAAPILYYSAAHALFSNAIVVVQTSRDGKTRPDRVDLFFGLGVGWIAVRVFITRKAVLAAMSPKRYKYGKRKVSKSQIEFARKRPAAETTDGEVSGEVE